MLYFVQTGQAVVCLWLFLSGPCETLAARQVVLCWMTWARLQCQTIQDDSTKCNECGFFNGHCNVCTQAGVLYLP